MYSESCSNIECGGCVVEVVKEELVVVVQYS